MAENESAGAGGPLAEWVVQLSAVGAEALQQAIQKTSMDMDALAKHSTDAINSMTNAMSGFDPTRMAVAAFTAKSGSKATGGMDMDALAKHSPDYVHPMAAGMASGAAGQQPGWLAKIAALWKEKQDAMAKSAEDSAKRIALTQTILAAGYVYLSSKILGFVQAGIAGTGFAEILNFRFEQLHREIAGIFTPAIMAVIDALGRLVDRFRALDGNQQATIRNLAATALAFLGIATVLPKVIQGIVAMGGALVAAFRASPLLALVSIMSAVLAGTEKGRQSLAKLGEALAPLAASVASVAAALAPVFDAIAAAIVPVIEALAPVIAILAKIVEFAGPAIVLGVAFYFIGNAIQSAAMQMVAYTAATLQAITATGGLAAMARTLFAAFAANPVGLILAAVGAIVGLIQALRPAEALPARGRTDAPGRAGGFESAEAAFERLESAANRTDIPRRQLGVQEQIRDVLWMIARRPQGAALVGA